MANDISVVDSSDGTLNNVGARKKRSNCCQLSNRVLDGFSVPLEQKPNCNRSLENSCLPTKNSYGDRLLDGNAGVAANFLGACL